MLQPNFGKPSRGVSKRNAAPPPESHLSHANSGVSMSQLPLFVDIHCHLLPGLDDGAATLEDALAMAKMAVADGIETIVATPPSVRGGTPKTRGR